MINKKGQTRARLKALIGRACQVDAVEADVKRAELEASGRTACFVEPIQREGGIHELGTAFLTALRPAADTGGFALIIDEISRYGPVRSPLSMVKSAFGEG